jgi:pyruvate dehydrogenase E1 component alpha subunit
VENLFQVVTPQGKINRENDPQLPEESLWKLYRTMLLTRALDNKLVSLQRQGKISFHVPSTGQEASDIGAAYALESEDWIFPAYREPGAALIRGLPVKYLLAQYFGNSMDVMKGHGWPCLFGYSSIKFVTPSAPVANQIPQAVGLALAAKLRGDKTVCLVFFGDGATSAGDFHIGMNLAGVYKVPLIFFCQNNHYSISTHVSQQTAIDRIAVKAPAYGFEGISVDGNDVLAVYKITREAVHKARTDSLPTLIEAVTYRIGPHSTNDDPNRYRNIQEVEEWKVKDPITRLEQYLKGKKIWREQSARQIRSEVEKELDESVREVEAAPLPPAEVIFDDVYEELPWHIREQREELLRYAEDS